MSAPDFSWSGLGELVMSAVVGCVGGVFAAGRFFGSSAARAEQTTRRVEDHAETIADHDLRLRALETTAAATHESVQWIKDALRTGRDPITQQPLGR